MNRDSDKGQPVCSHCRHFYITWDRAFPYPGHGIQIKTLPISGCLFKFGDLLSGL